MKLILTTVAVVLATVTALAADLTFSACTSDNQRVVLVVTVSDAAYTRTHPVKDHIQEAFTTAAAGLTAEAFLGNAGYQAFVNGLDEVDYAAIQEIAEPPQVVGACK